MAAAAFIALVVAAIAGALYASHAQKKKRDIALADIARVLGSTALANDGRVAGHLQGRAMDVAFITRGSGSSTTSWTEIRAQVGTVALELELRAENFVTKMLVQSAGAVDVQIGDEAFDKAFIVDGAPQRSVEHVLADALVRRRLLTLAPIELTMQGGWVMIAKMGWLQGDTLLLATHLTVMMAERIVATEKLGEQEMMTANRSYRAAAPQVSSNDPIELAALHEARARLKRKQQHAGIALVATVILVWLGFVFLGKD